MIRYTIRRVLWGVLVLLVITMVTFLLFGPVLQGQKGLSAASTICGARCTTERIAFTEAYLGLNRPWYEQYGTYLKRIVVGPSERDRERACEKRPDGSFAEDCDVGRLGTTFVRYRSVDAVIRGALGTTFSLTVCAALVWLLLSIPIGVLSALRRGSFFDRSTMVAVLWGQALPVYYFGLLALYFLAYLPNSDIAIDLVGKRFEIFPLGGYADFELANPWPWAWHMILPAGCLALQFAALYVRMLRSQMLSIMGEDYIRTARAKGAPGRRVVVRHGLRNALLPLVTMFGMDIGILIGGAILTEITFGLDGIGHEAVRAVRDLDVPLTSGIVLVGALAIVTMNILVDLFYAVLDPRVRLS